MALSLLDLLGGWAKTETGLKKEREAKKLAEQQAKIDAATKRAAALKDYRILAAGAKLPMGAISAESIYPGVFGEGVNLEQKPTTMQEWLEIMQDPTKRKSLLEMLNALSGISGGIQEGMGAPTMGSKQGRFGPIVE